MELNRKRLLRITQTASYNSDLDLSDPESDQEFLNSIYPISLYPELESVQTVEDWSTLFEDSDHGSDKTEIYSNKNISEESIMSPPEPRIEVCTWKGEAAYQIQNSSDIPAFAVEGITFRKTSQGEWKSEKTSVHPITDQDGMLYVVIKDLYTKGKNKHDDEEQGPSDKDQIKELLEKKDSELTTEEKELVRIYQRDEINRISEQLLKLNQDREHREQERANQKNQSLFDQFDAYLRKNPLNPDDHSVLRVNIESEKGDESDDETASFLEDEEDDKEAKKQIMTLARAFKKAGLGGSTETKWAKFPKFRGGEEDPYEWLDAFETACEVNSVRGKRMLDLVASNLEGPALAWWRTARRTINIWESWKDELARKQSFKYQFLTRFCGPDKQQRWMDELRSCKQAIGETVSEYYGKLQILYRKADPIGQYPERDFYQQFLKGLRTELRTAVRMAATTNVQEALEKAKAAEAAYSGDGILAGYSLATGSDNELKKELRELKELLAQKANRKAARRCDLCYKFGHEARDCPNSSYKRENNILTCFICGEEGHTKRDCNLGQERKKVCFRCGEKGHWAKECHHQAPKQILKREEQQLEPVKRVFVAHTNQLDPEDQKRMLTYYQPNVQYMPQPPQIQHTSPKEQQPDTLAVLAKAVSELSNKVNNLKG